MSDASKPSMVPQSDNPALIAALGSDLRELDYTVDGVERLLGAEANNALHRDQLVPAILVTRQLSDDGDHPLAAVVRLWLLGETLSGGELDHALSRSGAAGLVALGLVEEYDGGWRATVDLRPHGADNGPDLWVVSDLGAIQRPGVLRRDHVLGVGQASLNLAQFVERRTVDRALDLGTGCGIQLFYLLDHARFVVATDISGRALAITRFNLVLNAAALGLDPHHVEERVELRRGNMLEPVAGERFDLVVSNPPFVITPRRGPGGEADRFVYRDGGLPGDDIVSSLIQAVPDVLASGGTAQLLGNWEIREGGSWDDRIRGWVPDGTDAWVVQREQVPPAEYAETWLRDAAEERDQEHYIRSYSDYLADFASREVAAVGLGMVWLRRPLEGKVDRSAEGAADRAADGGLDGAVGRSAPGGLDGAVGRSAPGGLDGAATLQRFEEVTHAIEQPIAPAIAAGVKRNDWLAIRDDDGLRHEHLIVAADVTEERHQRPGAEHPGVILLRQGAGFRRTTLLSSELAGFVSVCDGELTVGQIITALGALLERDDEDFESGLMDGVRGLVRDGFLVPAAFDPDREVFSNRD